jgi:hypothetical protein
MGRRALFVLACVIASIVIAGEHEYPGYLELEECRQTLIAISNGTQPDPWNFRLGDGRDLKNDLLVRLKDEELLHALSDDAFLLDVVGRRMFIESFWNSHPDKKSLRLDSIMKAVRPMIASILTRRHYRLPPSGTPMSEESIAAQAKLLNVHLQPFSHLYRIDTRAPGEFTGFMPNPQRPSMTLWEHTMNRSTGSGNLVSLTTDADNTALVKAVAVANLPPGIDLSGKQLIKITKDVVIQLYEYSVEGVTGAEIPSWIRANDNTGGGDLSYEREVITGQVPPGAIRRYRTATLTIKANQSPNEVSSRVKFGDWLPIPK